MSKRRRHTNKVEHGLKSLCTLPACLFGRKFFTIHYSLLPFIILLLTGCHYKDLDYEGVQWVEVNVVFDWTGPNGTKGPSYPVPADKPGVGMTVLFYNLNSPAAEPIRYDLPGRLGGTVRLYPGKWRALAYNYDTETILYRGMADIATLEAYTRISSIEEGTQLSRSGMPRADRAASEDVILEPDPLWGAAGDVFTLTDDDITTPSDVNPKRTTITLYPTTRVYEVTVTILNVPNLQYSNQFGAALSGLAPSVWMESAVPGEGSVTQAFSGGPIDETTLQMSFRTFGHCTHADGGDINPHILTVYVILADGSKWFYTVDVTDQLHPTDGDPSGDDHTITIVVDGLPIPKPIVNGSGFHPSVDGWQGVEIDVTM